jgi:hypothetical protein
MCVCPKQIRKRKTTLRLLTKRNNRVLTHKKSPYDILLLQIPLAQHPNPPSSNPAPQYDMLGIKNYQFAKIAMIFYSWESHI